jgi:hypothetical protein
MGQVDIFNFNDVVQKCDLQNSCGHTKQNINQNDFDVIGSLYDKRIGAINYISFSSPDPKQIFTSGYPYHGLTVLKCKTCGMPVLYFINQGGIGLFPEYFFVEKDKVYIHEPATKNVVIPKTRLEQKRIFCFHPADVGHAKIYTAFKIGRGTILWHF